MTTEERRAMEKLGCNEEHLKRIQEAHKLFRGLWDDDSFIELWKSIPDEAADALFNALDKIEAERSAAHALRIKIDTLQMRIQDLGNRLVYEYAENGNETTKEIAIEGMGERMFYRELLTGGYDLTEEDREEIADLIC